MGLQRTIEGRNLSVTCFYISGKPNATTFYWTKADSEFRYDYRTLWIPNIGREDSGSYVCNAENIYSSGNKGTANATIEIDVQCQLITSILCLTCFYLFQMHFKMYRLQDIIIILKCTGNRKFNT